MWTISLPLAVAVSSKKEFILNLNRYRNAHFQVLAKAKVEFERVVKPRLKDVPKLGKCYLEYVHYPGKGQVPDTNNVCSIVDKFFADTLVNCGILKDDSPEYREDTRFRYGGRDRENPRVDVIIRNTEVPSATERTHTMQLSQIIKLSTDDVQKALRDYLNKIYPQAGIQDNSLFTLNSDKTYEIRVDLDLDKAAKMEKITAPVTTPVAKPAQAAAPLSLVPPQPAAKPVEPVQTVLPAMLPPSPSPALVPGQSPSSGLPAASQDEMPMASAETPEAPPPQGDKPSLFANFPKVSN